MPASPRRPDIGPCRPWPPGAAPTLLLQVAPRVRTAVATAMGWRLDSNLRQRAMAAVSRPWGIAHLEDPAVANLLSQTAGIGVAGYTPGTAVNQLINSRIATTLTALASGALLIGYHWWAAALLLAVRAGGLWPRCAPQWRSRAMAPDRGRPDRGGAARGVLHRPWRSRRASAKDVRLLGIGDWIMDRLRGGMAGGPRPSAGRARRAGAFRADRGRARSPW